MSTLASRRAADAPFEAAAMPGRRHLARLRFPKEMEARFNAMTIGRRMRHYTGSGLIALLVYDGFLFSDWLMMPDVLMLDLFLRLAVTTPLILFSLWLGTFRRDFFKHRPDWMFEGLIVFGGLFAAATFGVLLYNTRSLIATLCHAGFMPMIVYGNVVQRLRFRHAVVLSVGVMFIHVLVLAISPMPLLAAWWPLVLMNAATVCFTLSSNYDLEYEERQRFLLRVTEMKLLRRLNDTHGKLEALSRSDALTGVANRRHVDEYLQAHLQPDRGPMDLALLLLDVDHFKAYNDRYGHPAGDACLRQVAQTLSRLTPANGGLVARWGGEEFLIVLPGATASSAHALGQAVQTGVLALGLKHEASSAASCVTVSVGVVHAQGVPSPAWIDELVVRADHALYEAKHQGRNRVVMANFSHCESTHSQ